eukprot:1155115-Prymnesium_polylepis.1
MRRVRVCACASMHAPAGGPRSSSRAPPWRPPRRRPAAAAPSGRRAPRRPVGVRGRDGTV